MIDIFDKNDLMKVRGLTTHIYVVKRSTSHDSGILRSFVHENDAKEFMNQCNTLVKHPCTHSIEKVLLKF